MGLVWRERGAGGDSCVSVVPAGGSARTQRGCERGWGEETAAFRRYLQVASMHTLGGDFGAAWFACLGFILHPLVSLPRSSFLLVGSRFTL